MNITVWTPEKRFHYLAQNMASMEAYIAQCNDLISNPNIASNAKTQLQTEKEAQQKIINFVKETIERLPANDKSIAAYVYLSDDNHLEECIKTKKTWFLWRLRKKVTALIDENKMQELCEKSIVYRKIYTN